MRAEHRVTIDAATPEGRMQRSLRGVIAVERPNRFRLRALGPGGITLFDLLYIDGQVQVLQALGDRSEGSKMGTIVEGLSGDLAAAYALAPNMADRATTTASSDVTIRDKERTVLLEKFQRVGNKVAPTRIAIDNRTHNYQVMVDVVDLALDEPLDPALFAVPQGGDDSSSHRWPPRGGVTRPN